MLGMVNHPEFFRYEDQEVPPSLNLPLLLPAEPHFLQNYRILNSDFGA